MRDEKTTWGFQSYTIEPRGQSNDLVAVFQWANRQTFDRRPSEWVFNEASLANRVSNLNKDGLDASFSRKALSALRLAKRDKGHALTNG